jgi:hypothetical protein
LTLAKRQRTTAILKGECYDSRNPKRRSTINARNNNTVYCSPRIAATAVATALDPMLSPEDLQKMFAELTERKGILEALITGGEDGHATELMKVDERIGKVLERMCTLGLATEASSITTRTPS